MILLFLLLPAVAFSTASAPPTVDWTGCDQNKLCLCSTQPTTTLSNLHDSDPPQDPAISCEIGMQNKWISQEMSIFQVQVLGKEKGNSPKLMVQQGTKPLFGCTLKDGKIDLVGDGTFIRKYRIKLFEDRSRFESKHALCAFKIDRMNKFYSYLANELTDYNTKLIATLALSNTYESQSSGANIFARKTRKCNPYWFKDLSASAGFRVLPLKDRVNDVLSCVNYGASYSMRYELNSEQFPMKQLECKETTPKKFEYYIVKDDGKPPEAVGKAESHSFFCAAPLNETCSNPLACVQGEPGCPKFDKGTPGNAATLTCEDKKWLIDGEYYILDVEPVCKEDPMATEKKAAFYTQIGTMEMKTEVGQCFTDYDCKKKSKLDYPECKADDDKCDAIEYTNNRMECKDKSKQLKITNFKTGDSQIAQNFTCNPKTGLWQNVKKEDIAENSRVRCYGGDVDVTEKRSSLSEGDLAGSIGGILGGGLFLAIVILGTFYGRHRMKTKARMKVKGNDQWMSMKFEQKMEHCKTVFGEASQSTASTQYRVCHGLRLVSVLLETETADPRIWEVAFHFLMRIQWTFDLMEFNIASMYARYMYLEAKKIIVKHGWTNGQPIRKRTDKGLMRVVAIRLLSLTIHDEITSEDSIRLAEEGFRKLGFKGQEHYPQCGVLWSVMPHCQIYRRDVDDPSIVVKLDREEFMEAIEKTANEITMDKEDIIPEFGSPADQAWEAIGGLNSVDFQTTKRKSFMKPGRTESGMKRYFLGMGYSLYRNPSMMIFGVFHCWKVPIEDAVLTNLLKLFPVADWTEMIERIMKLMVYYGTPLEAKKLQNRFFPAIKQPSELYNQLSVDQQFFEEGAEAQKDEIRKWLGSHTDKRELKKAPTYTVDPKQDASIFKMEPAKPDAPAGTQATPPGTEPAPPGSEPAPAAVPETGSTTPDPTSPHSPAPAPAPIAAPAPPKKP